VTNIRWTYKTVSPNSACEQNQSELRRQPEVNNALGGRD